MMSSTEASVKPPGSCDLRFTDSRPYIENVSMRRIQTKLRSTEYFQTTLRTYEKRRFGGAVIEHKKIACGFEPFTLEIEDESLGSEFTIQVYQRDTASQLVTDCFQFIVRAELSVDELHSFLKNAELLVDPDSMRPARFYRNNKIEDEERLMEHNRGYYELVRKGHSGHRASPLIGKINGVYWSSRLQADSDPRNRQDEGLPTGMIYPPGSHYGTNRRSQDADKILNESSRLFLGDLHCYLKPRNLEWHTRPHYPLLIVCQQYSSTYNECIAMKLIELDWKTNSWLRWKDGQLWNATKLHIQPRQIFAHDVWPEILVCDTNILIENGLQSKCSLLPRSTEQKSFFGCHSCHRRLSIEESDKKDDNNRTRKRLSIENAENHSSPTKKPFHRFNSDSQILGARR